MPTSGQILVFGVAALLVILVLYLVWPYLIAFLALVGAAQIYRVWRNHHPR